MKKRILNLTAVLFVMSILMINTAASVSAADKATDNTASNSAASEASDDSFFSDDTATGQDVVDYAMQFVGNPYVYGGTSLTNGADCSGFVMAVYENFGFSLPHYSGGQMSYGTAVDASELEAGDLVFYGAGGSQHVAIYVSDNQVVHAVNSRTGIAVTDISWTGTPSGYRRLI